MHNIMLVICYSLYHYAYLQPVSAKCINIIIKLPVKYIIKNVINERNVYGELNQ